jgi:hypothetical protein
MKIQCELCKEISEIGPFRIDGEGIHVTCGVCREGFFVPSGEPAPEANATSAAKPSVDTEGPTMRCPKCDLDQTEGEACIQCGLRADRFDAFAADDDEQNQVLAAVFAVCEADWADEAAHERFAAAVSKSSSFAYGAKRYKRALRERPGDATAKRQLDRLGRMAEAKLFTAAVARQSEEDVEEPYRAVVILIIILVLALAAGGYYVMTKSERVKANKAAQPPTMEPNQNVRTNKRRPSKRRVTDKPPPRSVPIPPKQPDKQ